MKYCKFCSKSFLSKEVARVFGKESSVYQLGYCSAKCYTESLVKDHYDSFHPKLSEEISISYSKNIYDFKNILEGFVDDFGFTYYHTILGWCNILDYPQDGCYWQVYLVKRREEIIGICGLYSNFPDYTEELWLGWFGIVPKYRNNKYGELVLDWLKITAKDLGANKILSYVDKNGKPLNFYKRNGFKITGTVKDYLKENKNVSRDNFENLKDYIISCDI
jgi:GNAT superfamily N-acetyltransferase